jgi:putative ABC transport system permease protein
LAITIVEQDMTAPAGTLRNRGEAMFEILRSARYAGRGLLRSPAFSVTVFLTLALTIAANSAVFSVIDRAFLRPLPFTEPDRLVYVSHTDANSRHVSIPPSRLRDWRERSTSFDALATYFTAHATETTGERPELVRRAMISPGFLDVWQISPVLGRGFLPEEHRFGGPASVLVSDRYWRSRLNGRSGAIGESLVIEARPATVIGVMPPEFSLVDPEVDVWAPLLVDAPFAASRQNGWFGGAVGRLRPGVPHDQATRELQTIQARLATEYPDTDRDLTMSAIPYRDTVVGPVRGSLWLLFGAVAMLVLIACTNIAGLLLARTAQRQHEIAVRSSLGASRRHIAAQVLIETTLLVLVGTAGGLLLAHGTIASLRGITQDLPTFGPIALDTRVVLYTLGCAVVVIILCGLIPALRATGRTRLQLRSGRAEVSGRQSLNWALVGIQVALSVTLLVGSGLLLRAFNSLGRVDAGFESNRVLTFIVHGNFREAADGAAVLHRINRTIEELEALPDVQAVATAAMMPGASFSDQRTYTFADWTPPGNMPVTAENRVVSPSYFETLRIPLLGGQVCAATDSPIGAGQVMVNREFADRYFGTTAVVGHTLAGESPSRIVGVVGNAREIGMHVPPAPTVYSCYSAPTPIPVFLLRATGKPMDVAESVRRRLAEIEPLRSVYEFAPLGTRIIGVYSEHRLRTVLLSVFAVAALSLACLGIYGTLSYILGRRQREVGVRMALGALRSEIVTYYLRGALKVVGLACVAGLLLALALGRFLSGMLYGLSATDPPTLAAVLGVVLLVSVAAALVPTLRASRVDPVRAMREE